MKEIKKGPPRRSGLPVGKGCDGAHQRQPQGVQLEPLTDPEKYGG